MQRQLIITADGSHSIYVRELDEQYHSKHGAIQESKHVFINAGLKKAIEDNKNLGEINILEIGLGTGLNALLTFIETQNTAIKINYTAIEAFPVSIDFVEQLNYSELLCSDFSKNILNEIHTCVWEQSVELSPHFIFHKMENTLQKTILKNNYNLVYFDAFGPRVQLEMWTEDVFEKIYQAMLPKGILVTYCAKGEVKRTLKKVGFVVESLPGPPGKREMTKAEKP
jgi:tRNA U34 5-methylaminomethyl-2-thiouridine-forming methyltransferase MnmC